MRQGMTIGALAELVNRLGPERVRLDEPLDRHTTFRIGGPADVYYVAVAIGELVGAIKLARELGVPCFVLGLGANILVGDRGIRGLVVKNECSGVDFTGGGRVVAESGVIMADLIALAEAHELSGLEHFAGIPSTVGGALWQNLHFLAPDRQSTVFIAQVLKEAVILTEEGRVLVVDKDYFQFGYDESTLHHRKDLAIQATFELLPRSRQDIRQIIDANLKWRGEKHPNLDLFPSAGSVFRKIEGLGAGRLIDECGLKGAVIGGAQVSPKHANFIVNLGGATADDVVQLIDLCKQRVRERFSVELETEISLVGDF